MQRIDDERIGVGVIDELFKSDWLVGAVEQQLLGRPFALGRAIMFLQESVVEEIPVFEDQVKDLLTVFVVGSVAQLLERKLIELRAPAVLLDRRLFGLYLCSYPFQPLGHSI